MIYICILYLKYLETYLETLHSHFQPNCHFKIFKNSGSVVILFMKQGCYQSYCTVHVAGPLLVTLTVSF
jgi:hypothetical protein